MKKKMESDKPLCVGALSFSFFHFEYFPSSKAARVYKRIFVFEGERIATGHRFVASPPPKRLAPTFAASGSAAAAKYPTALAAR